MASITHIHPHNMLLNVNWSVFPERWKISGRIQSLIAPRRSDVTFLTLIHETDQRSDFQIVFSTLLFIVWGSAGTLLVTWSLCALFLCSSTMVFCLENWRHHLLISMSQLLIIVDGNKHSLAFFFRQFTWNLVKKLQKTFGRKPGLWMACTAQSYIVAGFVSHLQAHVITFSRLQILHKRVLSLPDWLHTC